MIPAEDFVERLCRVGADRGPRRFPRKMRDREILMKSIVMVLDSSRIYSEGEINAKLRLRIREQTRTIRVFGKPDEDGLKTRENVKRAIKELGADVYYEEVEDEEGCARLGIHQTPAVTIARQWIKCAGKVPEVTVVKEWLKQLEE